MGSVITQVTLVLGLLCLVARGLTVDREVAISFGLAGFLASATVFVLVRDGSLSHLDGLLLISFWAGGTALLGRRELRVVPPSRWTEGRIAVDVGITLLWLGVIGLFAVGVVQSFLEIADLLGLPEFIGSFIALSIGTSLPELVVDWTAIRRGAGAMAFGVVFGSSFVDATLSVGIGPLLFGSSLSDDVVPGVALAAVGVLAATVLVARSRVAGPALGVSLLVVYAAVQTTAAVSGSW